MCKNKTTPASFLLSSLKAGTYRRMCLSISSLCTAEQAVSDDKNFDHRHPTHTSWLLCVVMHDAALSFSAATERICANAPNATAGNFLSCSAFRGPVEGPPMQPLCAL